MMRMLTFVLIFLFAAPAFAVDPDEILANPTLETRARDISQNLRCLVCQNQSIDDSDAPLAKDLRVLVRERLVAGDADDEVIRYVVARYGDYVLLKPPLKMATVGLWAGPFLIFLLGAMAVAMFMRRNAQGRGREAAPGMPLSEAEKQRLKALLDGDGS